MKQKKILATFLTTVNIVFLSGCNSPPWISENHKEDFGQVLFEFSNDSYAYNTINRMCGQLGHLSGSKVEFNDFDLVNNTIEKSKSSFLGTPVNIKKAQFNGTVNLYCLDFSSNPYRNYNNIAVSGEVTIYQEVSEVNSETFKSEWRRQDINILINEH